MSTPPDPNHPFADVDAGGLPGGLNVQAFGHTMEGHPNIKLLTLQVHPLVGDEMLDRLAKHLMNCVGEWAKAEGITDADPIMIVPPASERGPLQ